MQPLRAIIFSLSGVLVADARLQRQLTEEVLQPWGIVLRPGEYRQIFLNNPDAAGFFQLLERRGRAVNEQIAAELAERKQHLYEQRLVKTLPRMAGLEPALARLPQEGLVAGALLGQCSLGQAEHILRALDLRDFFQAVVVQQAAPPAPEGHRVTLAALGQVLGEELAPWQALAVESTYAGILAAQTVGLEVLAIPSSVPFHMLQRRADWVVDRFDQVDWAVLRTVRAKTLLQG